MLGLRLRIGYGEDCRGFSNRWSVQLQLHDIVRAPASTHPATGIKLAPPLDSAWPRRGSKPASCRSHDIVCCRVWADGPRELRLRTRSRCGGPLLSGADEIWFALLENRFDRFLVILRRQGQCFVGQSRVHDEIGLLFQPLVDGELAP